MWIVHDEVVCKNCNLWFLSAACVLTSLWLLLAQLSFKFLILCFQCLYLLQDTTVFIVLCPVDKTCALTTFREVSVSPMPEHDTIIPRVIQVWLLYWDFNVMRQKSKTAAVAWNLKPGHLTIRYIHPPEATNSDEEKFVVDTKTKCWQQILSGCWTVSFSVQYTWRIVGG